MRALVLGLPVCREGEGEKGAFALVIPHLWTAELADHPDAMVYLCAPYINPGTCLLKRKKK